MLVQSLSGVRGIFGRTLTLDIASKYSAAYFSIIRPKLVVVGMDSRHSGPAIKTAMIGALGCNVIDVGILPTPAIQNAVRHFKADGGIIITASHNPSDWNGFKFLRKDGSVLYEKEMEKVIAQYSKTAFKAPSASQRTIATRKREEAIEAYKEFIFGIIGENSMESIRKHKLTLLIDPNGGAGIVSKDILEAAGINVIAINADVGEFAHEIEPTEKSLSYLIPKIRQHKAAFASGFDCDADRVEIVLSNGTMLSGNEMIALAAKKAIYDSRSPKKETIVINNATSTIVQQIAEKKGAKLVEVEVGEANVVQTMKKLKSKVGGEGSSSGVILSPSTSRDGILATLLMASLIAESKKPLSQLLKNIPTSCYLKEKVSVSQSMVENIKKKFLHHYKTKAKKLTFDSKGAVKVWLTKRSFVWLRDSKTEEGVLRVIVDAPMQKEATFLMKEALSIVKKV